MIKIVYNIVGAPKYIEFNISFLFWIYIELIITTPTNKVLKVLKNYKYCSQKRN